MASLSRIEFEQRLNTESAALVKIRQSQEALEEKLALLDPVTAEKLRPMLARELEQAAGNGKLSGLIDDCGIQAVAVPAAPVGGVCLVAGCGKPTWNGNANEYCIDYYSGRCIGGDAQVLCKNEDCSFRAGGRGLAGAFGPYCSQQCSAYWGEPVAQVRGALAANSLFSLEALQAEIAALTSSPPPFVTDVGNLQVPSVVCNTDGKLIRIDNGIWDVTMRIVGSEKNHAYNFPFLVSLRFDRDWPKVPPDVRFNCVIHHGLLDDDMNMMPPFYQNIRRDEGSCYTVASVVDSIHLFLEDPLLACGVDATRIHHNFIHGVKMKEAENQERLSIIGKYSTQALHKELFENPPTMRKEWFDPGFWEAHQAGTPEAWRACLHDECNGEIFSFPVFTLDFCELLLEEVFNFYASGLPAKRPNSMNNYGIILNEIGLEPFITELQKMFQPIGEIFFPGAGYMWDGHHCFIVRYREGEDLGLDMHTDDSDVTFNCCLGLDFDGAGLQFCGLMGAENHRQKTYTFQHKKGSCVVHLGRKRHGADDISRGERMNIILWNHSSTYRSSEEYKSPPYVKEIGPPDPVCLSFTHDRDYGSFKEYPVGKENLQGRGWCPPQQFEYEDFQAESPAVVGCGHCGDDAIM